MMHEIQHHRGYIIREGHQVICSRLGCMRLLLLLQFPGEGKAIPPAVSCTLLELCCPALHPDPWHFGKWMTSEIFLDSRLEKGSWSAWAHSLTSWQKLCTRSALCSLEERFPLLPVEGALTDPPYTSKYSLIFQELDCRTVGALLLPFLTFWRLTSPQREPGGHWQPGDQETEDTSAAGDTWTPAQNPECQEPSVVTRFPRSRGVATASSGTTAELQRCVLVKKKGELGPNRICKMGQPPMTVMPGFFDQAV